MIRALHEALSLNGWSTFSRLTSFIRWKLNWHKRDLDALPDASLDRRFVSARQAMELIPDQAVVASSGFAGCGICNALFWALRESFQANGYPGNLTWITAGAQGGRGKVPGTVEELAIPGLLKRYVAGHLETVKDLLKLGDEGLLEIHTLPQGVISRLLALQGEGVCQLTTHTGRGTFLDPACGGGSAVTAEAGTGYVETDNDQLIYQLPAIKVAFLSAPYADREGNLYFHNEPMLSENYEVVKAANANGGVVIAMAGEIIERDEARISIIRDQLDAIVIHPYRPQMAGVPSQHLWAALLPGRDGDPAANLALIRLLNQLAGITPARNHIDEKLVQAAVRVFLELSSPNQVVNFGVGMPEEVCRLLALTGQAESLAFTTESGTYGGVPASGIFFGASVNPERIESSAWMFKHYQTDLDMAVLGFLQVDSHGNVNVSKRGEAVQDFVGPGGFCDITEGAKTILFVGSWMVGGEYQLQDDELTVRRQGKPKFVQQLEHITFNAQSALQQGKRVYYVADVGVFKLTPRGIELCELVYGIDVQKDIIDACEADILVPSYFLKD